MNPQEIPKYPRELIYAGRQNSTLAVFAHLSRPDTMAKRNGDPSEPMVKGSLSRFVIKLIGSQGGKKFNPMANISQLEVKSLKKKSDFAFGKVMEARMRAKTRPCEMELLKINPFAGKTPMEVLRENPQNANTLSGIMNTLSQSINDPSKSKFRASNINQYNAIQEALQLFSQRKLAPQAIKYPPIVVHNATFRHLDNYTDDNGNVLCYELRIVCEPGAEEYPFTVYISNSYAPKGYNGKPDRKRTVNRTERFMPLMLEEYAEMIDEMYDTARDFEQAIFQSQYGKACSFDKMSRELYRKRKEQEAAQQGAYNNVTQMPQRQQAQNQVHGSAAAPAPYPAGGYGQPPQQPAAHA